MNTLANNAIYVSRKFLAGLQPTYGRVALFALIGLQRLGAAKPDEYGNKVVCIPEKDFSTCFGMEKKPPKEWNRWWLKIFESANMLESCGIPFIEGAWNEKGKMYISYAYDGLQFFEDLEQGYIEISTNALIACDCSVDDHSWAWLKLLLLNCDDRKESHKTISDNKIKRIIDVPPDAYTRLGRSGKQCKDYTGFLETCINKPLRKIKDSGQFNIAETLDDKGNRMMCVENRYCHPQFGPSVSYSLSYKKLPATNRRRKNNG